MGACRVLSPLNVVATMRSSGTDCICLLECPQGLPKATRAGLTLVTGSMPAVQPVCVSLVEEGLRGDGQWWPGWAHRASEKGPSSKLSQPPLPAVEDAHRARRNWVLALWAAELAPGASSRKGR